MQITGSSYSEILVGQTPNPIIELQHQFSEVLLLAQSQAENERSKLQHQTKTKLQSKNYENKNWNAIN